MLARSNANRIQSNLSCTTIGAGGLEPTATMIKRPFEPHGGWVSYNTDTPNGGSMLLMKEVFDGPDALLGVFSLFYSLCFSASGV